VPATNFFANRIMGLRACIYAIGPEPGNPLKVGLACNVKARRDELQIGNWVPLMIHRAIFAGERSSALRLERRLIERLDAFRIPDVRGDWFSIDIAAFDVAIHEEVHGQG
jgi:hypothetical protein